jgi:hypothetical protein
MSEGNSRSAVRSGMRCRPEALTAREMAGCPPKSGRGDGSAREYLQATLAIAVVGTPTSCCPPTTPIAPGSIGRGSGKPIEILEFFTRYQILTFSSDFVNLGPTAGAQSPLGIDPWGRKRGSAMERAVSPVLGRAGSVGGCKGVHQHDPRTPSSTRLSLF